MTTLQRVHGTSAAVSFFTTLLLCTLFWSPSARADADADGIDDLAKALELSANAEERASAGEDKVVGVARFELTTSTSRT